MDVRTERRSGSCRGRKEKKQFSNIILMHSIKFINTVLLIELPQSLLDWYEVAQELLEQPIELGLIVLAQHRLDHELFIGCCHHGHLGPFSNDPAVFLAKCLVICMVEHP